MAARDLKAEIIAVAAADAAFREQLLRDPRAAISARFGVTVPPALRIDVVEDTAERVTIPLPLRRDVLPEGMLEAVAGGTGCTNDQPNGLGAQGPVS